MHGSNMFCHVALAREHFLAVGARNALNTAVLSLSHMNVPEEKITEKIDKETISKSLGPKKQTESRLLGRKLCIVPDMGAKIGFC